MDITEEDLLYFDNLRDVSLFKNIDNKNINLSLSNKVFYKNFKL